MRDISDDVFDMVEKPLMEAFGDRGLTVLDPNLRKAATFPCVTVTVINRAISRNHLDSGTPQYEEVSFQFDVYTNDAKGRKDLANQIQTVIDDTLLSQNFIRTECRPIPGVNSSTIYRLTSRYHVETDGTNLYRRR